MVQIKDEIDKVKYYAGPIINAARDGHTERLCKQARGRNS